MKIRDYQALTLIPTGATYEAEVAKYFGIDLNQPYEGVQEDITAKLTVPDIKIGTNIFHKGKVWNVEKDFLNCTFEQWIRLETLLAEDKNTANLHKLLAIYCRPAHKRWYQKKYHINKYDLTLQDQLAEDLLDLDMAIAKEIIQGFFLLAIKSMSYIKIHYLNQLRKVKNSSTKPK